MALARQGQSVDRAMVNGDSNAQFTVTLVTYTLMWDPESHKGKSPVSDRALQIPLGDITQVPQGLQVKTLWLIDANVNLLASNRDRTHHWVARFQEIRHAS